MSRRRGVFALPFAVVLGTLLALPTPARTAGLVADLSNHLIGITTAFVGSNVLIYGALDDPGSDVAVIVEGPTRPLNVQRKGRFLGIWLQRDEMTFRDVPGFYAVATSRPLAELAPADVLARHGLDIDRLPLRPMAARGRAPEEVATFREALVRNKRAERLFAAETGQVEFLGERLFRTTIAFPSNTPPGSYRVQVLNLVDGRVQGAQTSVLVVSKIGLEADLFEFAHERAWAYAGASIIVALGAGWIASAAFRRA